MNQEERVKRCKEQIDRIAASFEERFQRGRLQLSFSEYLDLFSTDPRRFGRDASTYLKDMFDHYGTETVDRPWGKATRWKLFDLPWESGPDAHRYALVGQEEVQGEVYRVLENFVRGGRPNRVMLLHGPNGSSKSTVAACMMKALEDYSEQDQGALYRFHWVFPNEKRTRGPLGFRGTGKDGHRVTDEASYAHMPDEDLDARLLIEVRDHPLFLIPVPERRVLLNELWTAANLDESPPDWLVHGELAHKNRQVLEALLSKYKGSLSEVLRHVQVERYFISRRYRVGAVTLGPQMSIDAGERQVTADHSLAALPVALQATTLYEAFGELVDAAGGLLEFSDLLKRPLDAYKYLQLSVEAGEVALSRQNLMLNCVMIGSANEIHLAAFREHPEFPSFRGRMELIRTGYLLDYAAEKRIYDNQVAAQVQQHVAPHATLTAATFAVLTRMVKPDPEKLDAALREIAGSLTAMEKADLISAGTIPERLSLDQRKVLHANLQEILEEGLARPLYEGIRGASPREMQTVLLDAAQHPRFQCLSPVAVLEELDELCERAAQFDWLQESAETGGYHDHALFRDLLTDRLLGVWEEELRTASGLVDEKQYAGLFVRYTENVSAWSKGERIRNRVTGEFIEPDANLMEEVESLLGWEGNPDEFRRGLLSKFAAWTLDHPNDPIENHVVFADLIHKLRAAVYAKLRKPVGELCRDMVDYVRGNGAKVPEDRKTEIRRALDAMRDQYGYCDHCASDAAAMLVRKRFHDIIV
jgi:predicted Ser/Thr protein kinase